MRRAVLLMAVTLAGCFSSGHVGRDPRKVYMTIQDGQRGYMKHGQFHREWGFGGSLVDVVGDHPEAARAARTFRGRAVGGFLMAMGGLLCMPTALVAGIADPLDGDGDRGLSATYGYIAIGCGVLAIAGTVYLASGMPYQLDAVNIYNDAVDAQRMPWPPPPAPQLPPVQLGPPGQ